MLQSNKNCEVNFRRKPTGTSVIKIHFGFHQKCVKLMLIA